MRFIKKLLYFFNNRIQITKLEYIPGELVNSEIRN